MSESHFLSTILVGFVNGVGNAMNSDVLPVDFGEFTALSDGVVEYLTTFSKATFGEDLHTITNVYFAIADSGVLSAMKGGANIMDLLNERREAGDDVLSEIIDILKSNQRTSKIITAMTKTLISTLIPEDAKIEIDGVEVEISYDTVKGSVSDILAVTKDDKTEEEFKAELSTTLDSALKENKIELEQETINGIVDHINENYDEIYSAVGDVNGELTDEQFNNILLEYYSSFTGSIGGGSSDGSSDTDNSDSSDDNSLLPGIGDGLGGILDGIGGGLGDIIPGFGN